MEDDYIKEKEKELVNIPKSIPLVALKLLIPKAETNICKVICNDGGYGTGFFCNIKNDWNIEKVLMTNNHVLNEEDI